MCLLTLIGFIVIFIHFSRALITFVVTTHWNASNTNFGVNFMFDCVKGFSRVTRLWQGCCFPHSKLWIWRVLFTLYFLFQDKGCGLIPGCEKCSDGLVCKKCRRSFIPIEYERSRKTIIRCSRSCPVGYNITSRKAYPKICVRTQLGK